jgi:hypothetical protein
LEGSGFFLEKRPADFLTSSTANGAPVLARPVVNALTGAETVELIAAPGVATGNVAVASHSSLYGWDVNLIDNFHHEDCARIVLLGGFRYLHLDENLDVLQNTTLLPGGTAGFGGGTVVGPSSLSIFDHFGTLNEFYGGQLGARVDYGDRLFVSVQGKIALGATHEVINIAGATTRVDTMGNRSSVMGGLLALSSNTGRFNRDEFAAVPEIGVNIGYRITPLIRAYVGYTFLYWSEVARPGDQISRTINPSLLPTSTTFGSATTPTLPALTFQRTDFWAQGINVGLEFRY